LARGRGGRWEETTTGGGVIAYYKSKRWGGRGVSFKGTATSGTFVVKGINGSRGTARGSFHC
jgi:hypothetical protein